jgi:hypothetical protein
VSLKARSLPRHSRRHRALVRAALSLPLLTALSQSGSASAQGTTDDKRACAEASEEAQLRRIHNKLRGAREELLLCARDVCPPLVKHDCDQWLAEVDASMPTIVVSAVDRQGHDAGDVRVEVDGGPFLQKLDGNATAIDPGEHAMRFVHEGDPDIQQKIIVREGEKNRQVSVQFGLPAGPAKPQPATVSVEREKAVPGARSPAVPVLAYSLLGVGAVALGISSYFEIDQLDSYSSLKNGCSLRNNCTQEQVNAIANERVYAGVFLGVGIAAAGTGVILLVTRPHARARAETGVTFDVAPTRGGGSASLRVRF